MSVRSQGGQAMVEFMLTIGLLVLAALMTLLVAISLHHRSSLDTATREGAFEAALAGHDERDGERATRDLWSRLDPEGGPIDVRYRREGRLIIIDAEAADVAGLRIRSHAVHTVEQFEPGSSP